MNLLRKLLPALALCVACASTGEAQSAVPSPGFSFFVEAGGGYVNDHSANRFGAWDGFFDVVSTGFSYASDYIDFGAAFHFTNDGKYSPTEYWMSRIGNQYFMLDNGYTRLHAAGLAFEGGWLNAYSTIETPYEVFLNPAGRSALGMVLSYEDKFFQYESRWIGVNVRSTNTYDYGANPNSETWLDKGVNYRLIAVKFSGFRVGYEESSVYLRTFDPNYFFSPLPSILTNTLLTSGRNPWSQGNGGQNDNSLMGLFSDYRSGPLYAEAQILVDDINLNFLFPSLLSANLSKLAWSIGGRYTFPFGTLGFWHGGATAHTYAASYSNYTSSPANPNTIPYEYMYYPTVYFGGNPVDPRDSSIGFPWGENALAFKVTFDTDLLSGTPWAFGLSTSIEYVINGSKSPDNPWHQYASPGEIPERIQLFDVGGPEVLNNILILHAGATKRIGSLEVRVGVDVGGDFNALGVTTVAPVVTGVTEPSMLTAMTGLNYLILDLVIGVRYTFAPGSSAQPK